MSYFARLAARASSSAVREATSVATPAMLSRSPLVEHDQRLTLPGFAERALLSGEAPSSALSPDFGSAEASPTTGAPVTVARKASSPSFMPSPSALGLRAEGAWEPASGSASPARGEAGIEEPFQAPQRVGAAPWASAERPRSVAIEPRAASPAVSPGDFSSPGALPGSLPSAVAAPTPAPGVTPKPAELAPPARSIFEALSRADAWTRSAPRAEAQTPAVITERAQDAAAEPRPPQPAMAPAVYAEPPEATIGLPGGPIVSIGRLEIEVVAPPRAETVSAPRRLERQQRTSVRAVASASFAAPRAYGWRQR
jgi:hypothetical protein